jgi:hypothetical protein
MNTNLTKIIHLLMFQTFLPSYLIFNGADIEGKLLFLENDLYPGKKMSGLQKLSNVLPFRTIGWLPIEKSTQQSGNVVEKESYSLDEICGGPAAIGEDKFCATSS